MADAFAVQSEVADKVAASLALKLLPQHQAASAAGNYRVNPDAYEAYLKARYFRALQARADIEKALSYSQKAVEIDPQYAAAWAGLSDACLMMDLRQAPPRYRTESLSAAEKAIHLDPSLAEAHVALGLVREIYDWNWKVAERCLDRAIELNPNSWSAHSEYGILLQRTGNSEAALPESKRSVELNPAYWGAYNRLALSYIVLGDHRRAVEILRKALELQIS
jgi:tetratricopeptide (TPR) repeat protein